MEQKSGPVKELAEEVLKDVRRQTRRHYSSEDKIRIVLEGLRGQKSIVDALPQRGVNAGANLHQFAGAIVQRFG